MKIQKVVLRNVKTFKHEVEIEFNDDFNILVGPNGSGKSNLLDTLTICIRHFLLKSYRVNVSNNNQGVYKDIVQNTVFDDIRHRLDKFYGDNSVQKIQIDFLIKKEDIDNIREFSLNAEKLTNVLADYRNGQSYANIMNEIKQWDATVFRENDKFSFVISNYTINYDKDDKRYKIFFQYLSYFELLLILSEEIQIARPHMNYLYFGPYRGANLQNLKANLSSENFYQVLQTVISATSKSVSSLIRLSTVYFAEKRRVFEEKAAKDGYEKQWDNDEEVRLVTKYLEKIGYNWNLKLIDPNRNIYEIFLLKDEKEFSIDQASSGEKEMINFLLGIFAFNINNGIIIIDEPELHLHPKWQSILLNLFIELSSRTKNQFIFASHSPTFITGETYNHVIRVYTGSDSVSRCSVLKESKELDLKDILHIVNSTNNEKIFFADIVILVEGITDRLIFQKILEEQLSKLDVDKVIEIVEIKGKKNIDNFRAFLLQLKIPCFFISDLDYINEVGDSSIRSLFVVNEKKIEKDVLINPKSKDGYNLVKIIEDAIQQKRDCSQMSKFWEYIKSLREKIKPNLAKDEENRLNEFLKSQIEQGNYILKRGDIEDYFPEGYKKKDLNNVISLLKNEAFERWKTSDEYKELSEIIKDILIKSKIIR